MPTLWDINVFYRSVNEEFLRTPFFRKKKEKKKILFSPLPPFSPHFVCSAFVCGVLLGISNEKGKNRGAGVGAVGSPPAPTAQPGQGAQVHPSSRGGRFARDGEKKTHFGHVKLPPRRKSCPVTPCAGRDASARL